MDTINTIIENEIEHYQYKAIVYCNEKNISLGFIPGTDDAANAFEHSLMHAYYTYKYGYEVSDFIGHAWEKISINSPQATYMDLTNNDIGNEVGLEARNSDDLKNMNREQIENYLLDKFKFT